MFEVETKQKHLERVCVFVVLNWICSELLYLPMRQELGGVRKRAGKDRGINKSCPLKFSTGSAKEPQKGKRKQNVHMWAKFFGVGVSKAEGSRRETAVWF